MAINHVFSNAQSNATGTITAWNGGTTASVAATDVVRPQDWNSAHNQAYTLSGNTSNNSTVSGTNVILQGAGAITLQGSTSTIVFSAPQFTNSNNITFGTTNGSVTASFDPINIGVSTGGNTAGNTGTYDGGALLYVFEGNTPLTLSQSTGASSVTMCIQAPVMSTHEPYPIAGASTASVAVPTATSGPVSIWPFMVPAPLSAGVVDLMFSASFVTNGTSSGQQSMGVNVGLYARGAGGNSTRLESVVSKAIGFSVTGNNSTYSINQQTATSYSGYGATAQTSSAGVNITSQYTGLKKIAMPVNSYLSPGQYYLAIQGTNSTSSVNVGISLSYFGAVMATQATALAPMGSLSSAYSTGSNPLGGRWREGYGAWSSAGSVTQLPASINFASITASNISVVPHMRFWST